MPTRPPRSEDSSSASVHVRVPAAEYDRLYQRAKAAGVSVPEVMRQAVQRELDEKKK